MNGTTHNSDFLSGILFALLGGSFALIASEYEFGTATRMGPGYLPMFLGCAVVVIGLMLIAKSFLRPDPADEAVAFYLRPGFFVLGSMLVFAIGLRPLGVVISAVLMVIVSSFAAFKRRWWETGLLSCGLAIFSAIVFVKALGVPMPIWPRGM